MKNQLNRRGQALMATVVAVAVVSVILITAIVSKNTLIQKSGLSSTKSLAAYNLANAAVQKGIWALNMNTANWNLIGNGGTLPGYAGDVVYSDIPGGSYKINIVAGPGTNDRTITAYAKDQSKTPNYRGLQVVLSKSAGQFGAIMAPKIKLQKRAKVHWGPIYAYTSLDIKRKSRVYYPRLFSKGAIKHIDNDSSLPNTDGVRWWSYNYTPGVPAWPQIDFEYYKSIAKAQGTYYAKGDRTGRVRHHDDDRDDGDCSDKDKDGGCAKDRLDDDDKSDDDSYSYQNIIDTQPYVRFYDTGVKAKFKNGANLLRGVIIAMDTIEFRDTSASVAAVNAKYAAAHLSNYYPRAISVPSTAWKEYQKIDTASTGDYPGDKGGPGASGVNATYTFGADSSSNLQTTARIHIEGFVYAGKQLKLHRGGAFIGALVAADKSIELSGSDEDDDDNHDDDYDCDHHSSWNDDDNRDHHHDDPPNFNHKEHNNCDNHHEAHSRRMTFYYQDNLAVQLIGSGQKQTLFKEVASPAF